MPTPTLRQPWLRAGALLLGSMLLLLPALRASTGCLKRCDVHADCPEGVCDEVSGFCVEAECARDEDCGGAPFECVERACEIVCGEEPLSCPDGMVPVCGAYCIDSYEASRPDATAGSAGSDESMAVSQPGVIPWYDSDGESGMNAAIASAACEAAGKRLCSPFEWAVVCATTQGLRYSYGEEYSASTCNGIDTFCDCDQDGEPDGDDAYPHCRDDCPADYHVMPTGSFPDCTNELGAFDINGNVWELVTSTDGQNHYRGGAYNCSDSEHLHQCAYDGVENGGFPSAKGFRCCADPAR
jgi:hypothetical protein